MATSIRLLFISLGVLLTGHGLSQTLVPVFANELGWTDRHIGLIGASYFLGFVIGCLTVPKLLSRAGHIRVFLTLAGLTAASIMVLRDLQHVAVWIGLRMLGGWCLAAIYTVAESWINEHAENSQRARLISTYVLVSLIGMASGQVVFGFVDLNNLFALSALLILVALVPIGLFCDDQPMALEQKAVRMRSMRRVSLHASTVMFVSGIVTGSVWAMTPLIVEASGLDISGSGFIMMAVILGGAAFQLPVGFAAERFGRGPVTTIIVTSCLVVSVTGLVVPVTSILQLGVLMFLLGGTSLSLYALAGAEANESSSLSRIEIATALLLMNGIGSVLGPVITGFVMGWAQLGLFVVSGAAMVILLGVTSMSRWFPEPEQVIEGEDLADVIPIEEFFEDTPEQAAQTAESRGEMAG